MNRLFGIPINYACMHACSLTYIRFVQKASLIHFQVGAESQNTVLTGDASHCDLSIAAGRPH